jgi:hypothetical protein
MIIVPQSAHNFCPQAKVIQYGIPSLPWLETHMLCLLNAALLGFDLHLHSGSFKTLFLAKEFSIPVRLPLVLGR